MRHRSRLLSFVLPLFLLALSLAACGGSSGPPKAGSSGLTTITFIQSDGVISYGATNVALAEGFFKQEGLTVKYTTDHGDDATLPAVATGGADFAIATTPTILNAIVKKEPIKLVGSIYNQVGQQYVINKAAAERIGFSPSMTLAQKFDTFKGRHLKVATLDIGGALQLVYNNIAQSYGLDPNSDYTFSAIPSYSSLLVALKRGEIDIATLGAPYGYDAVSQGYAEFIADLVLPQYPRFAGAPFAGLIVGSHFAKAHPAVVQKVKTAMDKALAFMHSNPQATITILKQAYPSTSNAILNKMVVTQNLSGYPADATITQSSFNKAKVLGAAATTSTVMKLTYSEAMWSGAGNS